MADVIGTLRIDPDLCEGHGRCYSLVPRLFDADEVGTGMVSKGELVSADLDDARRAQGVCPERAILIELSE